MEKAVSLAIMKEEIEVCMEDKELYGWEFSSVDEENLTFTVRFLKSKDGAVYKLFVQFDHYKEWPPFLDFIDEITGEMGVKNAYPTRDGFFQLYKWSACDLSSIFQESL